MHILQEKQKVFQEINQKYLQFKMVKNSQYRKIHSLKVVLEERKLFNFSWILMRKRMIMEVKWKIKVKIRGLLKH